MNYASSLESLYFVNLLYQFYKVKILNYIIDLNDNIL